MSVGPVVGVDLEPFSVKPDLDGPVVEVLVAVVEVVEIAVKLTPV